MRAPVLPKGEEFAIARVDEVLEAIMRTLDPDEREGDRAIFSSGYGAGPTIIDVRAVAHDLVAGFDIRRR